MWTSTLDLDPKKILLTQLIGRFYPNIYFSSLSPLQVLNSPRQPLPASNWVRVRNRLAGICGSDMHLIYGDGDLSVAAAAMLQPRRLYPGHETVGEIIEIGDDVQRLNVGDRVSLRYGPNCVSAGLQPLCRFCATGHYNLCENSSHAGLHPIGGGWCEEMLIHEQQLFPLSSTLSDEQAVMLEPSAVAVHAILRHLPQPNEHVLIIGAGTIGLLTLQVLRALTPKTKTSVLARHSFQVEQATRLGATHIIYPHDSYIGVKNVTNAKLHHGLLGNKTLSGGFDVIFDTVGQRNTLHHALRWIRSQGTIVLVGISLHQMKIDLSPICLQEINLIGSTSHGMEVWPLGSNQRRSTFSVTTELIERELIHPEQLITHHFALNNYKHALETAHGKRRSRAIKVVFDYSLLPASVVPNVRASGRQRYPVMTEKNKAVGVPEMVNTTNSFSERQQIQPIEFPLAPTTPRTPAIQVTPPVAPLDEEALRQAMSYVDEDENDDTATAIPIVSKYTRVSDQPAVEAELRPDEQKQESDTESSLSTAPANETIVLPPDSINTLPISTEESAFVETPPLTIETANSDNTIENTDEGVDEHSEIPQVPLETENDLQEETTVSAPEDALNDADEKSDETKDSSTALPYVDESPTIRVQPRSRNRKRR